VECFSWVKPHSLTNDCTNIMMIGTHCHCVKQGDWEHCTKRNSQWPITSSHSSAMCITDMICALCCTVITVSVVCQFINDTRDCHRTSHSASKLQEIQTYPVESSTMPSCVEQKFVLLLLLLYCFMPTSTKPQAWKLWWWWLGR